MEPGSTPRPLVQKKTWRDSLPIDMLLSTVSILVVAQSSSQIPKGLMNNPVYNGWIKLKQILNKWDGRTWTGPLWVLIRTSGGGGSCENVASCSVKGGKLADWLIYCDGRYNIGVGLLVKCEARCLPVPSRRW